MWRWIRLLLRDLRIHFWSATLCLVRRRHRALVLVGHIGKPGFRGVPIYQCRKCYGWYLTDADARRLGGK